MSSTAPTRRASAPNNPCGWSPTLGEHWVFNAGRHKQVKCFDIMELSPPHDQDGRTARLAARMLLAFLPRLLRETIMTHPIAITNARILTLSGSDSPRRGNAMRELAPIDKGTIVLRDGKIESVGVSVPIPDDAEPIDAQGRVVMPAFVDCHTHACWAGDRLDEWELKQRGATYLEILESGGGIMSTVRAVRQASTDQLTESLLERLNWMLAEGTTACEVKSGYGLSTTDELKMLDAIVLADQNWAGRVSPTACIRAREGRGCR